MSTSAIEPDVEAVGTDVLRRKGKSFYWAGQLLTGSQLERAANLYRLCRTIDDLADEASTPLETISADRQLRELHEALVSKHAPAGEKTALYQQAESLLGSDPIALGALADLVDTVRQDLSCVRLIDHAELLRYSYGVAGTVGVMMTCLLNAREQKQALPHAIDLGIAMQLTNISRDVLEDAHLSRLYLPANGMAGSLAPEDLIAGDQMARHRAWLGVRELLGIAEIYYRSGWQGLGYLPFRSRLAIAVAAKVYREIGQKILRRGEAHYWQSRCVVGPAQKLKASAEALVQLALGAISRHPVRHDPALHQSLRIHFDLHQQEQ
jgi:phytoene synthase